jgi:hypothetical protein
MMDGFIAKNKWGAYTINGVTGKRMPTTAPRTFWARVRVTTTGRRGIFGS